LSKENIKNCIDSILEKDFSNAKLIIAEKFVNHSNEKTIGIKFALEGIISKHSGKNSMNKESSEYLKLINKSIKEKLSAPLVDDFEKGYFSVWKIFVKLSLDKLEIDNEKRIIENPGKEEQTNKSSNSSSE
tara:strand:+ start:29 stop:421 length:393 start_codon:yes stop_codon:yes gene_type:complete